MEKFQELMRNRHEYARDWKARTGGKVVGTFCTYVPEEIIYAAGMLPVRIFGSHEPQDVTEPYIHGIFCAFCRDVLAQGLQGRYDYLDGIVKARSCMHMRNAWTAWRLHIPTEYSYYVSVPALLGAAGAKAYLIKELIAFKKSLEDWRGRPITDEDLDRAIEVYNTDRRLLRQIYELRKAERPPLTGAEAMEMTLASEVSDKADHSLFLREALEEFQKRDGAEPGVRLMLIGTEEDDTEFVRLLESLGSTVVIEDHCTGSRYFWNEVIPQEDRLEAIAERYIHRPRCPAKDLPDRSRSPHLLQLVEDFNVQGAVLLQQKWCEPFEFDIPSLIELLKERGIPSLHLEYDLAMPLAQYSTRVEAFLEMLQLELV